MDVEAAIDMNKMSPLEKARFIRYTATHLYSQQPNPTPSEYAEMAKLCVDICPCLADGADTLHKVKHFLEKILNYTLSYVSYKEKLSSKFSQRFRNMRRNPSTKDRKRIFAKINDMRVASGSEEVLLSLATYEDVS